MKRAPSKSKLNQFPAPQVQFAELLSALAHPARITIVETLAKRGECICGEIVEVVPLAQSTVSQHLKQLREVGLIQGELDGPRSCYCLNRETFKRLRKFFAELDSKVERCCETDCNERER